MNKMHTPKIWGIECKVKILLVKWNGPKIYQSLVLKIKCLSIIKVLAYSFFFLCACLGTSNNMTFSVLLLCIFVCSILRGVYRFTGAVACLLDCNHIWFHFVLYLFSRCLRLSPYIPVNAVAVAVIAIFFLYIHTVRVLYAFAIDDFFSPFLMSFVFIASFSISFAQVLALKNRYLFLYHLFCYFSIVSLWHAPVHASIFHYAFMRVCVCVCMSVPCI